MEEEPEVSAVRRASGAERLVPEAPSAIDTTPASLIDTGVDDPLPELDVWQLIESGGGQDPIGYMGDLIVQGLEEENLDDISLPQWLGGTWTAVACRSGLPQENSKRRTWTAPSGFGGTPDVNFGSDDFVEARLGDDNSTGQASSSSAIRVLNERLAPQQHQFFWETDPFLQMVFGNKSTADTILGSTQIKRPHEGVIDVDSIEEEAPVMHLLKRKPVKPVPLHAKALKHVAASDDFTKRVALISDWATIVAVDVNSFAIGAMLQAEGISRGGILDAVKSCFSTKATSALQKRYCAMKRYVQWAMRRGRQIFPLTEHVAYAYVVCLREDPACSATSGQSFFEAIHFSAALLGMKRDLDEIGDQRIRGVAEEMARSSAAMQQADALKKLEAMTCLAEDLADTLTLGGMLIMLYGCARHSDLTRAKRLIWDAEDEAVDQNAMEPMGYIELQVLGHKTARSVKMKRTYMPVEAFELGV